MDEDDYEILPHKEIQDLKEELEKLKKGPTPEAQSQMGKLTDSINMLLNLFKDASSQMHLEEKEADMVSQKLGPIEDKLDQILEQNQKIAEGIIALADIVKELKSAKEPQKTREPDFNLPNWDLPPPSQQRPMPPMMQGQMPPLPPLPPRRR